MPSEPHVRSVTDPRMKTEKVYIITRADLEPGAQIAQSCHVAFAFSIRYPHTVIDWNTSSNNLVCLSAPDEASLLALADRARQYGCAVEEFREPDYGDSLTAIALTGERAKRAVSALPLALKRRAA